MEPSKCFRSSRFVGESAYAAAFFLAMMNLYTIAKAISTIPVKARITIDCTTGNVVERLR
jgi:hypothetical protein